MFDSKAEAEAVVLEGQTVEYCEICEAWTIIDTYGYPECYCV